MHSSLFLVSFESAVIVVAQFSFLLTSNVALPEARYKWNAGHEVLCML
jgi:hypothetical protein